MALDTKENLGGNGSEAAAPRVALDGDLVNQYLELQVRWLNLQLEAARREEAASGDEAALAITTGRLWHEVAPTAVIVLLLGGAVALLSAVTWSDLWRGISTGQPGDLMFVTSQTANVSGQVRSLADFMREWKDVLLSVVGGGVLLGLKRLAYRSVRSAVVIVLALGVAVTLLAGMVIADIHLVQNNLTPMHVSWRGWATLAVAIVIGVVLMIELGDVAHSSPASFQSRSQRFDGFRRWISLIATGTWPGRFLGWLTTPRGSLRWLASIGLVTAASIVLSIPGLVAAIVSNGSDFWAAVFALSLPLGPLWWLLLLAVVAASPAGRHPAGGLPFALFAAVPALSVAVFVVVLLTPAVYDTSGSPTTGYALFAALAIETWVFWLLWAGIALSAPLRIVFLPVVLLCLSTIPMYYGLLPFLGLVGVLSVGVPWALWRSRPAPVTP